MQTMILIDGGILPDSMRDKATDALIASWDGAHISETCLSIPAEVDTRLMDLRRKLMAWTWETGKHPINGKLLEAHLCGGETLSMWWCSTLVEKHPKVTTNLFAALKVCALEQIMDEHNVTALILVSNNTALRTTLVTFCQQTGRAFTAAPAEAPVNYTFSIKQLAKKAYYALPSLCKAIARFTYWLLTIRRLLPYTADSKPAAVPQRASIVTYFPNIDLKLSSEGRFRSRYLEQLHDAITDGTLPPVNWLFIYFPSPQCALDGALCLRKSFAAKGEDGASFHFLEEFLDTKAIWRALWRFTRLTYASFRVQSAVRKVFHFTDSHMDLWPLLKSNWGDSFRGWRALERCLMHEAFKGYAAWCGPQVWSVYIQENCPWERMFCQAMHEAGNGTVYGSQHSTVRPTDFRYFDDPRTFTDPHLTAALPDQWLLNGSGAMQALIDAGMPHNRAHMVEALRYMYLAPQASFTTPEAASTGKQLLLVTSFFADETNAHLHTLAEAYRKGILKEWDIRIKAHPYLPVQELLEQLRLPSGSVRVVESPIGDLLKPGVVVWASNSTTVALEAAYRKLPVLVQAAKDDTNLSPLQNVPGIDIVRDCASLEKALQHPQAPLLADDYLCLTPGIPRWRAKLGSVHGTTASDFSS